MNVSKCGLACLVVQINKATCSYDPQVFVYDTL